MQRQPMPESGIELHLSPGARFALIAVDVALIALIVTYAVLAHFGIIF